MSKEAIDSSPVSEGFNIDWNSRMVCHSEQQALFEKGGKG